MVPGGKTARTAEGDSLSGCRKYSGIVVRLVRRCARSNQAVRAEALATTPVRLGQPSFNDGKRLYVAIFRAREDGETFIKIGVSAFPLTERFAADLRRFEIESVVETEFYKTADALIVESNFHQILRHRSYSPRSRLRSGNTECFVHSAAVLAELCRMFEAKRRTSGMASSPRGSWRKHVGCDARRETSAAAKRWGRRRHKKGERRQQWGDSRYHPFG